MQTILPAAEKAAIKEPSAREAARSAGRCDLGRAVGGTPHRVPDNRAAVTWGHYPFTYAADQLLLCR